MQAFVLTEIWSENGEKIKGSSSKLIHALGMKLRESVSSKVVYKVILVTHLQAIVHVNSKHAINHTKGLKGWHRSADSILDLQYWLLHWLINAVYLRHLSRYICRCTSRPVLKLCRRAYSSVLYFTLWVTECSLWVAESTLWVLKQLCRTMVNEGRKPTTIIEHNKREFYGVRRIINKSMLGHAHHSSTTYSAL